MVHLKLSVFVLALAVSVAIVVAVESEILEEKVLAPPGETGEQRVAEPPDGGPPTPSSHNEARPPHGPPSHPPDRPPPGHGVCSGQRPRYCYQTDYCSQNCYKNPGACYAGGLGDYYCNQYCSHTYGNRWYGRDEGCYCYCYRRD